MVHVRTARWFSRDAHLHGSEEGRKQGRLVTAEWIDIPEGVEKIVSVEGGYHGHTGLALAAGDPQFRDPFGPNLPGFVQVPFNDRGAMEAAIDGQTAAVILEAVPATLGMPIPGPGYFAGIRELCDERGLKLHLPRIEYCVDNAAMIGLAGRRRWAS